MKIFVPRYRHTISTTNNRILDEMFLEIHENDLPNVINFWRTLDKLQQITAKSFFSAGSKEACAYPFSKNTLEPHLRRPHITIHCGAKECSAQTGPLAKKIAYDAGVLVAQRGFNLWYGGGDFGLMGQAKLGFNSVVKHHRYPDQYLVQISPAPFMYGGESTNGLLPANEALSYDTDIAIVMPDFFSRRDLLSSKSAGTFTCTGGIGSLDEATDILVHIKTGLRSTNPYIINPYLPQLRRGLWDPLLDLINGFIEVESENPKILDHINFVSSPDEAMNHLMAKLDALGQNPHIVYQEYCREHNITPPEQTSNTVKLIHG